MAANGTDKNSHFWTFEFDWGGVCIWRRNHLSLASMRIFSWARPIDSKI